MAASGLQLLVFLLCFTGCQAQVGACHRPSWQLVGDSVCMLFQNQFQLTADQARDWCRHAGASLIRFANYDSVTAFAGVAAGQAHDGWWSDLTDAMQPGVWTWGGMDRVTPGALGWAVEPTDTHHVENCVSMDSAGYLSDEDCDQHMGFICSYTPLANTTCAEEFTADNGQCYSLSHLDEPTELVDWDKASNNCVALPPHTNIVPRLASFTSVSQLQGLQLQARSGGGVGKRWVGLNDRAKEGQWRWANGERLADISFLSGQWKTYPDRGSGHSCGLVHSNGHMEEAYCEEERHFVCQISLPSDNFVLESGLGCPAAWIRGGSKCFLLSKGLWKNRQEARDFCTSHQGSLLKMDNKDERDWLIQQTLSIQMDYIWTGLKRASDGSATWVWDDGSPADPTLYRWDVEPMLGMFEQTDCALINTGGFYTTASCFLAMSFICEATTEDEPCPDKWVSHNGADMTRCYYVSSYTTDGSASWQEALNTCTTMAGRPDAHLLAVDSQTELDYVKSLMRSHPYAAYWTDLTDKQTRGVWQFSKQYEGSPLQITWEREPDNKGGHQNCAVIYEEGRYHDVDCSEHAQVLCEKPAVTVVPSTTRSVKQRGQSADSGSTRSIPSTTHTQSDARGGTESVMTGSGPRLWRVLALLMACLPCLRCVE